MRDLPTGYCQLPVTDLEGSTRLLKRFGGSGTGTSSTATTPSVGPLPRRATAVR